MTDRVSDIVAKTVEQIVNEEADVSILMECLMLTSFNYDRSQCRKHSEVAELEEILRSSAPQFASFNEEELKKIERLIREAVTEKIKDESLTHVQTFRLLAAYNIFIVIEDDTEYIPPKGNSKLWRCVKIYNEYCSMCFMESEFIEGVVQAKKFD